MDQGIRKLSTSKIVIEAYSSVVLDGSSNEEIDNDILKYLLNKKDRKLMSKQDKLALISAASAWKKIDTSEVDLEKVGIYYCVGILPFEDRIPR